MSMTVFFAFGHARRILLAVAAGHLLAGVSAASDIADLQRQVVRLAEAHKGKVAVAIKHLDSGAAVSYHETVPMPTASLIKFPVMVEAYRQAHEGQLDLNRLVTLEEDDKVPGSGILTPHFSPGAQLAVRDLIRLMIGYSDNTATNLVLDQIGLAATNTTMEKLGFGNTRIHSKVFRRDTSILPERSRQFGLGSTTAGEMIGLVERLYRRVLVSAEASTAMLEHLSASTDRTKLALRLPAGVKVAQKGGSVAAARCAAGIIFSPAGPLAVCVLTAENKDRRWTEDNAGDHLCGDIGRAVYDHFNPPAAGTAAVAALELAFGAAGPAVEDLQRTLNARLSPSPNLGVDGDFGPVTQTAVIRFQRQHHITANGVVGPATWQALGPLVTQDEPVPPPQVVNEQKLPRLPADTLDGPPHVTCRAWAIADGKTGAVEWGHHEDEPLDIASVTKIMTAYVVVRQAEREPAVLDEEVVFSERADKTEGSTAGVRIGEQLPVRELLYGLLLPSGNDASVALAEHFGGRFEPPPESPQEKDPLPRFLAEMNRAAAELGMTHSRFRNTHGLTEEGHVSTCRDLLRLGWTAMQQPLFRNCVGTRQHGCQVTGPGGYHRNLLWKNSNRLLPISGYDGIKTGTTQAAGACLVSSAHRGSDHLLVAVLGAAASDARYTDTRNLFRWAWRRRAAAPAAASSKRFNAHRVPRMR